jgi:hypothetical protein
MCHTPKHHNKDVSEKNSKIRNGFPRTWIYCFEFLSTDKEIYLLTNTTTVYNNAHLVCQKSLSQINTNNMKTSQNTLNIFNGSLLRAQRTSKSKAACVTCQRIHLDNKQLDYALLFPPCTCQHQPK